jgi:hypothetical protein
LSIIVILVTFQIFAFSHRLGHQRWLKRKPRTSVYPPDSGHITAAHRSATKSADARRGAADDSELRQAAGAAASVAADVQIPN